MARTKQTARKTTSGKRPRAVLSPCHSPPWALSPIADLVGRAFNQVGPKSHMRMRSPAAASAGCDPNHSGEGGTEAISDGEDVAIASHVFSQGNVWPLNVLQFLDPADLMGSIYVCRAFRDAMASPESERVIITSCIRYFAVTEEYADKVAELVGGGWKIFSRLLLRMALRLQAIYDPFEVPLVHRALLAENAVRRLVRSASPLWARESHFTHYEGEIFYTGLWDTEFNTPKAILAPTWENCVNTHFNGTSRDDGVATCWRLFFGDVHSATFGKEEARTYLETAFTYMKSLAPLVPSFATSSEHALGCQTEGTAGSHPGYTYFLLDFKACEPDGASWPEACARECLPTGIVAKGERRRQFSMLPSPGHYSPDYVVYEQVDLSLADGMVDDFDFVIQKEDPLTGDHLYEELTSKDQLQQSNLKLFCNKKWDLSEDGKLHVTRDLLLRVRKDWHNTLSPSQWEMLRHGSPAPFVMLGVDFGAEPEEYALVVSEDGAQEVVNWSFYYSDCDKWSGITCSIPFNNCINHCGRDRWSWKNRGLLAFCFGFLSPCGEEMNDGILLMWSLWSSLHRIEPFYSQLEVDWNELVADYEESEDPDNQNQNQSGAVRVPRAISGRIEEAAFRTRLLYLKHLLNEKLADPAKYFS